MSTNSVGIVLCAAAVGAILFLHGCHRSVTSENVTDQSHPAAVAPAKVPAKAAPAPAPARDKTYYAPGKYKRVLPGGKVDGEIDCTYVPPIAKAYPPAQVIAYAKKYGLNAAQLQQLRVCLK